MIGADDDEPIRPVRRERTDTHRRCWRTPREVMRSARFTDRPVRHRAEPRMIESIDITAPAIEAHRCAPDGCVEVGLRHPTVVAAINRARISWPCLSERDPSMERE